MAVDKQSKNRADAEKFAKTLPEGEYEIFMAAYDRGDAEFLKGHYPKFKQIEGEQHGE